MNIIDLFAGCGGLSTGFEMAGFNVVLAIERDTAASETYRNNHNNTKLFTEDITKIIDLEYLLPNDIPIDGIIGSPPCQGFSMSGNRDKNDPRNSLYIEYLRFVRHFKPKFFVMENVTGLLTMKTKAEEPLKDVILSEFKAIGYNVDYHVLNAADYGVPQTRQRVFFIGIRSDIQYDRDALMPKKQYAPEQYITIKDAISDLPPIKACEGTEIQSYPIEPQNDYQKFMRKNSTVVYNHIAMKHTKRLVDRFEHISYGQSVTDVPEEYQQRQRGNASKISGKSYSQNNMRPFPDRPSPTIPASFQSNFVHPFINRNYTAREGARLQSFPDTYIFYGNRTNMSWDKALSQYQQIGNAVPPLLAKAIGETIIKYFNNIKGV